MADVTKNEMERDADIDRLIRIAAQLYEELYEMGITWTEAEIIWLNLGTFIFSQGSTLSFDETLSRMKKCVDGWFRT